MVPTQHIFQDDIFKFVCINIEKCILFVLLFRMRTPDNLKNNLLMLMFKNDIDEHYKLLVPEIRNGLVPYINIDQANFNMQEIKKFQSWYQTVMQT